MMLLSWIFCFLTLQWSSITCIEQMQVHQEPGDLVLYSGSSLKVSCSISGTTNSLNIYWYRWTPATGFTLVFTSLSVGSVKPASEGQFTCQRPENLRTVLESAGVNETGSAVWYCAARQGSNRPAYFGQGTTLTVLEPGKEIQYPAVTVLNPSNTEECKKKRVTLVCLITDFYPDHVKVSWYKNGVKKDGGVATDGAATFDTARKSYKISSRLSIDHKEWKSDRTYTCTATFYDGDVYTDKSASIKGPTDTVEGAYKNKGKITILGYVAFLGKSAAYGFFIMFIIMRKYFVSK